MKVRTWLEKLTDESSLWFNAIKAEDDGDLISAVSYYLKDAQKSADAKSIIRHALSCSCAAGCLSRLGRAEPASKLYLHAADVYMLNAQQTMATSVRESIWSMNEAVENYVLADDFESASHVQKKLVALEARVNPFATGTKADRGIDALKEYARLVKSQTARIGSTGDMDAEVDAFLKSDLLRKETNFEPVRGPDSPSDYSEVAKSLDLSGGSTIDEKSIVS